MKTVQDITPTTFNVLSGVKVHRQGQLVDIAVPNQAVTASANTVFCSGLPKPINNIVSLYGSTNYNVAMFVDTNGDLKTGANLTGQYFLGHILYLTND